MDELEEITFYEEEATNILSDVSKRMAKAKKPLDGDVLSYLQNRMKRAEQAIRAMRTEIRELPKEKQAQPNMSAGQLEEKLKQLNKEMNSGSYNPGMNIKTKKTNIKKKVKLIRKQIMTPQVKY